MKNATALFFLAAAVLILPLTGTADPKFTPLEINSYENMEVRGVYKVDLLSNGQWQEVGEIGCDRFLRSHRLSLPAVLEGPVRLRLKKEGGGPGHLDAVSLGGLHPIEVQGGPGNALEKLSAIDHDVIDASSPLVLTFAAGGSELSLAGRIEPVSISKTPFMFPSENRRASISGHSKFYAYNPKSDGIALSMSGTTEEFSSMEPLFEERVVPFSGHPAGRVYGRVSNDESNLYVAVDFTPDNTMDGEADYCKVYVNTGEVVKEFKVTSSKSEYGKALFTYTDKVGYQHKYYEFKIPFAELGEDVGAEKIEIMVEAYGTAHPGDFSPGLAYDHANNRFLLVYKDYANDKLMGQLVSANAVLVDAAFYVSESPGPNPHPAPIAYDPANHRFMVIWENGSNEIFGQIVNADGSLHGDSVLIASSVSNTYDVAFDDENQNYLAVWSHSEDVYGRTIDASGASWGQTITVCEESSNYSRYPAVEFDSVNKRFLVSFILDVEGLGPLMEPFKIAADYQVCGQFVDSINGAVLKNDGGSLSTPGQELFKISTANPYNYSQPDMAFDAARERFLVVWHDEAAGDEDLFGQFVQAGGALWGNNFAITDRSENQMGRALAFSSKRELYLSLWYDGRSGQDHIFGQLLDAGGSPYATDGDTNFTVATGATYGSPAVAYNLKDNNFMAAFEDLDGDTVLDVMVALINLPPSEPELLSPADGATGLSIPVTLKWTKSKDFEGQGVNEELYLCENSDWSGCTPIQMSSVDAGSGDKEYVRSAGWVLGVLSVLFAAGALRRKKKLLACIFVLVFAAGMVMGACGGGGGGGDDDKKKDNTVAYTADAEDLDAATTYFWKVVSTDGDGFISRSDTRSFTTE